MFACLGLAFFGRLLVQAKVDTFPTLLLPHFICFDNKGSDGWILRPFIEKEEESWERNATSGVISCLKRNLYIAYFSSDRNIVSHLPGSQYGAASLLR